MWYIDTTDTLSTVLELSLRGITSLINICMLQPTKAVKPTSPVLVRMGNLILGSFSPVTLPSLALYLCQEYCVCVLCCLMQITLPSLDTQATKMKLVKYQKKYSLF